MQQKINAIKLYIRQFPYESKKKWLEFLADPQLLLFNYRESIAKEAETIDSCYLIVSGLIQVEKTLGPYKNRSKKVLLADIVEGDIVGSSEILLNLNDSHEHHFQFTYSVNSSKAQVIKIPKSEIELLCGHMRQTLLQREARRKSTMQNEYKKFKATVDTHYKNQEVQGLLQTSILPPIELKRSGIVTTSSQQLQSRENSYTPSTKLKSVSLSKLERPKMFDEIIHIPQKDKHSLNRKKSEIVLKKQQLLGEASHPTVAGGTHMGSKNDKIFKEQVKEIIRKKLQYQNQQLAILKLYRGGGETESRGRQHSLGLPQRLQTQTRQKAEINRYFNLEEIQ